MKREWRSGASEKEAWYVAGKNPKMAVKDASIPELCTLHLSTLI